MATKHVKPHYVPKEQRKKKRAPLSRQAKTRIAVGAGVLVVAIAALIFALNYVGPNWIMTNLPKKVTNSQGNEVEVDRIHKLGEVGKIEGFTRDMSQATKINKRESSFWMVPDDKESPVVSYFITGVSQNPAEMAETAHKSIQTLSEGTELGDIQTGEIGGLPAVYFLATATSPESGKVTRQITSYFAAKHNAAILVSAIVDVSDAHPMPADDEMIAHAQKAVQSVRFAK